MRSPPLPRPGATRRRRPSVPFLAGLLTLAVACSGEPVDPERQALREELGLTVDQAIHFVILVGEGAREGIEPAALPVAPGDVVIFESGDWRVHTLAFDLEAAPPDRRRFLEESRQLSSPPLLTRGSRFAVTFQGAPPGDYPFLSEAGGGSARGVITVRPPEGG